MRLIVLPCDPFQRTGYNRAVASDLLRLGALPGDRKVVYLERGAPDPEGFEVIRRPPRASLKRVVNLALLRTFTEVFAHELQPHVQGTRWHSVFCGEVTFYRALRALLPDQRLTVRFHNYFTLAAVRQSARRYPIGAHFAAQLRLFSRLEREIAADPLVDPIFINPMERALFQLQWPGRSAEVWGIGEPSQTPTGSPRTARFLYLGSTSGHQAFGLRLFIDRVLPAVRRQLGPVKFHLWGAGTERFDDPRRGVHGYGFRRETALPFDGDGLFVIPDLLGGGIKVKTGDALAEGRAFITTPFGLEGYSPNPDPNLIVADFDTWASESSAYFLRIGASPEVEA